MPTARRAIALLLAGLFMPVACKDGGPTSPDPGGNGGGSTPAITLTLSSGALTLNQGQSGDIVVALTRAGGFAGEISLSLENVPSGVTPVFSPAVVPVGGSASALTLAVGGSVTPGTHTLTVRATGDGVAAKTATISLTVVAVTVPGFTLSVANPTLSIVQGTSMTTSVSAARVGGFGGTINLSVSGTMPGLNATLTPSFIGADPSTLAVGATFNGPLGTHVLTVTATGSNVAPQTATVTVEVTPSNPVGEVSWQFCPASGLPVWFAYQDGMAGPWTRVTGVNDIFAFDLIADRGGVAFARQTATGGYRIDVTYATTEELGTLGQRLCAGSRASRTIHGTVTGLAAGAQARVQFGGASATLTSGGAFTLQNAIGGTFDLLAAATSTGAGGQNALDAMILRRGLDPADGSLLPALDFAGAEAFSPVGQAVTIGNLGTDQTTVSMAYFSAGRLSSPYFTDAQPVASTTRVFPAVPLSRQIAGDMHLLTLRATAGGASASSPFRGATLVFREAIPLNVMLGPALAPVTVTVPSASPYARLQASYPTQTQYPSWWQFAYSQDATAGLDREVVISATGGYFTTFSTITLGLPDFAGTGGWDVAYGPRQGVPAAWTFIASGWLDAGGLDGPPILDGASALSASRTGTITP